MGVPHELYIKKMKLKIRCIRCGWEEDIEDPHCDSCRQWEPDCGYCYSWETKLYRDPKKYFCDEWQRDCPECDDVVEILYAL